MAAHLEHAIQPWQQLLGTVIRVEDDGDVVSRSDAPDVVCASDSTHNRGLLGLIVDALAAKVGGATLGHL